VSEAPGVARCVRSPLGKVKALDKSLGSVPDKGDCVETVSNWTRGAVIRPLDWFSKHPAYVELQLSVSPAQFASIKRLGEAAFKDPLLVTQQGVIIDGYARKALQRKAGTVTPFSAEQSVLCSPVC
jgi:hypothetical protein